MYVIFPHEVIIYGETENCLYYQVLHLEYNYSKGLVKSKKSPRCLQNSPCNKDGEGDFFLKKSPRQQKNILSPACLFYKGQSHNGKLVSYNQCSPQVKIFIWVFVFNLADDTDSHPGEGV